MTDFASCPACHGRGVIPLAEAQVIEAHAQVSYDAARQEQREREAEVVKANLARRLADAEQRKAEIEAVLFDRCSTRRERHERQAAAASMHHDLTPEQLARLRERLAKLEAERAEP